MRASATMAILSCIAKKSQIERPINLYRLLTFENTPAESTNNFSPYREPSKLSRTLIKLIEVIGIG